MVEIYKCVGSQRITGVSKKTGKPYDILRFFGVGCFSDQDLDNSSCDGVKTCSIDIFGSDISDLVPSGFEIDKKYSFNFKGYNHDFLRNVNCLD